RRGRRRGARGAGRRARRSRHRRRGGHARRAPRRGLHGEPSHPPPPRDRPGRAVRLGPARDPPLAPPGVGWWAALRAHGVGVARVANGASVSVFGTIHRGRRVAKKKHSRSRSGLSIAFDGRGHDVWGIVFVLVGLVAALGTYADAAGALGRGVDDLFGW